MSNSLVVTTLFSVTSILISILTVFINMWVTFIPQLGIGFQYHRRWVQFAVAITAVGLALAAYLGNSTDGQLIVLTLVLLLIPFSGFFHASKALVAVDQPQHALSSEIGWLDEERVIGYAANSQTACAWALETLIPHHLVNDIVNHEPLLVAW